MSMPPPNPPPILLLLHGAYSTPLIFTRLLPALHPHLPTILTPQLATSSPSVTPQTCLSDDVHVVRTALSPYLDAGREVIIASHSYGGAVAPVVAKGESVREREGRGLKGGVRALLFMSALAVPESGWSVSRAFGVLPGRLKGEVKGYVDFKDGLASCNSKIIPLIFNDLSPADAEYYLSTLRPTSVAGVSDPVPVIPSELDESISQTYMICEKDEMVSVEAQEFMIQSTKGMKSVRVGAGHFAFLSKVDAVADAILEVARA